MALFENSAWALAMESNCPVCPQRSKPQPGLRACGRCRVVHYCSPDHQRQHFPKHKAACKSIGASQMKLEEEEATLRANPGDFPTPANVFENGVGHFWGLIETRDYMRARLAAANALLQIDTITAVEKALAHFQDMLRLCRPDNLGVRDIVPGLLLRLGREQECYDFVKWWSVPDEHYDWGDVSLPYLNISGADAFEAADTFASRLSLSQIVILTLLKLRLWGDIASYDPQCLDFGEPWPPSASSMMRPVGEITRKKIRTLRASDVPRISELLKKQWEALFRVVQKQNPYIWEAIVDASNVAKSLPLSYSSGSREEAIMVVHRTKKAWEESYDATVMIESMIGELTDKYEGLATPNLERRKGSGKAFPSTFSPPTATTRPNDIFVPTRTGPGDEYHFVHHTDKEQALAYVDGACSDNGQPNPQACWAAIIQPPMDDSHDSGTISGRLELKGPFGEQNEATSNRAELRAAVTALRSHNWRSRGFTSLVVATDSTYVAEGATQWARTWIRNGWKTTEDDPVKNRDLWELFLGEVEKCKEIGLDVYLWKIPRETNELADTAAKAAIRLGSTATHFENVYPDSPNPIDSIPGGARVLCICLEYEDMFNDLYAGLISQITAKAELSRASTQTDVLRMLKQRPPPPVILVTDAGVVNTIKIWERIIDCLRVGSTVVLGACFSSFVNQGQFDRCFAKVGLPWKRGAYHRTEVSLRLGAEGHDRFIRQLPSSYSCKALYVEGVARSDVWYAGSGGEVAVAFAQVGNGKLGYVGDVNGEDGSVATILAMLGF